VMVDGQKKCGVQASDRSRDAVRDGYGSGGELEMSSDLGSREG